jgi:hypothetical protein
MAPNDSVGALVRDSRKPKPRYFSSARPSRNLIFAWFIQHSDGYGINLRPYR